ncbi:hypothetical protein Fmac_032954 [Flemingia macrophylla]|uniref:Uncharacterized protein n=1 Tax=Flemingia macrophylla TaxID=520843 RepID=A0ABD1L6D9_9FABA
MPKVKRFRNPQKSRPQPQCEAPLTQAPTHSVPAMNPEIPSQPTDSNQTPRHYIHTMNPKINSQPTNSTQNPRHSNFTMNLEIPSQETDSTEAPEVSQEDEITILHVGRQSTHCWTVEAIDFEETIKKIKVKVKGVNNLPRELRIVVDFDDQGQSIGEAQALLVGFLGTLAADCKLFPMDYDIWSGSSGVPKAYFDDCFETILKEQIQVGLTQSTVDESKVSPLDVVGRVLGPEHSGRVRCLGLGAVPSNTFRNTRLHVSNLSSSSSGIACPSSSSYEWKKRHNNLELAFKAYIIMKEGRIPEELATYFTPDTHVSN